MLLGNVSDGPKNTNDAPPLPPRTTIIFARLAATPGAKGKINYYTYLLFDIIGIPKPLSTCRQLPLFQTTTVCCIVKLSQNVPANSVHNIYKSVQQSQVINGEQEL